MKLARLIVKLRYIIIIVFILSVYPAFLHWQKTPIIQNLLDFLPNNLNSVKGQKLLEEVFHASSSAIIYVENDEDKQFIVDLVNKLKKIPYISSVYSLEALGVLTIPKEFLPPEIRDQFYSGKGTIITIQFQYGADDYRTFKAIKNINKIIKGRKDILFGGLAVVNNEMNEVYGIKSIDIFLIISLIALYIILIISTGSFIIPILFLISMGIAYLINMGTNFFPQGISFVTQNLAAALQLGVTIDYSIFLLHRFDEEYKKSNNLKEAMAIAIAKTASSITTSSITTIIGFVAVTFMSIKLGFDLGSVLAKGVFISLISTLTFLPAMFVVFYPVIRITRFKLKKNKIFEAYSSLFKYRAFRFITFLIFIGVVFFSFYGYKNAPISYQLNDTYPENLKSIKIADEILKKTKTADVLYLIVKVKDPKSVNRVKLNEMIEKLVKLKGILNTLSINNFGSTLEPFEFLPKEAVDSFIRKGYMIIFIKTKYQTGSEESLELITNVMKIVKKYYKTFYLAGQSTLIYDFIKIAKSDFTRVNTISIILVFLILILYSFSIGIPILLVIIIETAVAINFTVPFLMHEKISFIAQIILGSIQLGATVDYAILYTNRFIEELAKNNFNRKIAVVNSVKATIGSVLTAALALFSATVGYAIFNEIPVVRTIAGMIGRGALISFIVVILFLPSVEYYLSFMFKVSYLRKNFFVKLFTGKLD